MGWQHDRLAYRRTLYDATSRTRSGPRRAFGQANLLIRAHII